MAEPPSSALTLLTEFLSAEHIEASARRAGFVTRASKMTGKLFLALVTFGGWSDAHPSRAQLAAKVTPVDDQLELSAEALDPRLNKGALAVLQDMIRHTLAKVHVLETVCEDGLVPGLTKVSRAERPGCALPASLQARFPGSGGSAATAGANLQAGWDDTSRVVDHCARTPWNLPDPTEIDTGVAVAHKGSWVRFAVGYFQLNALARMAEAGAYVLRRLNQQANILPAEPGPMPSLPFASWLTPVTGTYMENPLCLGATAPVACRLVASRVPASSVKKSRRIATKKAKQHGSTPAPSHREWLAWPLLITHVPPTIGQPAAVITADPLRWPIDLLLTSWKRSLH